MRNHTPATIFSFCCIAVLQCFLPGAVAASPCDKPELPIGQPEWITPKPGEMAVYRSIEVKTPGTLIVQADAALDEALPWVDVSIPHCLGAASSPAAKILPVEQTTSYRILLVQQPGVLLLGAGWVDPTPRQAALQVRANFVASSKVRGFGSCVSMGWTKEDEEEEEDNGEDTAESDNEILPQTGAPATGGSLGGSCSGDIRSEPSGSLEPGTTVFGSLARGKHRWTAHLPAASIVTLAAASEEQLIGRLLDRDGRPLGSFRAASETDAATKLILPTGTYILLLEGEGAGTTYGLLLNTDPIEPEFHGGR